MLSVCSPPLPQKHLKRGSSEKLFEYSSTEIPGEQVTDSQKTVLNADVNYVLVLAALFPHKHFFLSANLLFFPWTGWRDELCTT